MEKNWYYAEGDRWIGPLEADELRNIVAHTLDGGALLVWREGLADWRPARERPELRRADRIDSGATPQALPESAPPAVHENRRALNPAPSAKPAAEHGGRRRANFIARHWRGGFSLAVSYWVVFFLGSIATGVGLLLIENVLFAQTQFQPTTILASFVLSSLFGLTVYVWQVVGVWRSAGAHNRNPAKKKRWGVVVKVLVVLGIAQTLVVTARLWPAFHELTRIAFQNDPRIPGYAVSLTEGGTELRIEGGFKFGLLQRVQDALAEAPGVTTIDLESVGGRMGVARDLFDLIESKGLNTVANGDCLSACTVAFAGGARRWLGVYGKLGFHGAAFAGLQARELTDANRDINERIKRKNGTSQDFLTRVDKTPSADMWYPTRAELLEEKFISEFASAAASSAPQIENYVAELARKRQAALPRQIAPNVAMTGAIAEGNKMTYLYSANDGFARSLLDFSKGELQRARLHREICADPSAKRDMELGVVFGFLYQDAATGVNTISYEFSDC